MNLNFLRKIRRKSELIGGDEVNLSGRKESDASNMEELEGLLKDCPIITSAKVYEAMPM